MGWAGLKNGMLLRRIEGAFDAFMTIDSNLTAQQRLNDRTFGIIILQARSNRFEELAPLAPFILAALDNLEPGAVVHVMGDER